MRVAAPRRIAACALCLYQRWPWWVALGLAVLAMALRGHAKLQMAVIGLASMSLLVGLVSRSFTSAWEQHWWQGLASCGGVSDMPTTVEALKSTMSAPVVPLRRGGLVVPRYFDGGLQCPDFNGGRRRGLYLAWRHWRAAPRGPDKRPGPAYLPGDPTPPVDAMIRVDHAGEFGAVRIYEGQLAVLPPGPARDAVQEMAAQEQEHIATFNALIADRGVRPTALSPLWHVAGYALGAWTARMGPRAAMACTVAVEEVIDAHYREQAERLGDDEADLKAVTEKFRADELEHRDTARPWPSKRRAIRFFRLW